MSVSDIAVTALTAVATVKGNALTIVTSDPRSGALPNIALDRVDIYASQTDTFASASVVTQGTVRALHANAGEAQAWYYWGIPYDKLGSAGTRYPSGATGGVACTSLDQAGLAFGLANGKLVASASAGALTIAVKTAAGNDPSATDQVFLAFPNSDVTIGNYQVRPISAVLSITVPQFQNLGISTNNQPFTIWVVVFDDAGTLRLGVKVASNSAALISPIVEGSLASSSAVASATASYTYYTTTAVTSKPLRLLGEVIWNSGLASAGTYTAADSTRLVPPGARGPGTSVPIYGGIGAGSGTTTALIPFDDTIPQVGEGFQYDSFSYAARAACNLIEYDLTLTLSHSVDSEIIGALFVDGAANAVASTFDYCFAGKLMQLRLRFRVVAGSVSSRTYSIRIGASTAGTLTINGSGGNRKLGGSLHEVVSAVEIEG